MALRIYQPIGQKTGPTVLIGKGKGFLFSAAASQLANLADIQWMRVFPDDDDRLIVFEPVPGVDKPHFGLKLGLMKRSPNSGRRLPGKGLINQTPWIRSVAALEDVADRRFDLKPFHGPLPEVPGNAPNRTAWYIRLMPAFEQSIAVAEVSALSSNLKGIYRYLGGDDGREIVYIGKGLVKDRFQQEVERANWSIHRIEYSAIDDDTEAYEWERYWIERYKQCHNGRRPRYNRVDGHGSGP